MEIYGSGNEAKQTRLNLSHTTICESPLTANWFMHSFSKHLRLAAIWKYNNCWDYVFQSHCLHVSFAMACELIIGLMEHICAWKRSCMYVRESMLCLREKSTLTRLRNGTYASLWKVAAFGLCAWVHWCTFEDHICRPTRGKYACLSVCVSVHKCVYTLKRKKKTWRKWKLK